MNNIRYNRTNIKYRLIENMFARYIYNMFKKENKNQLSWNDVDKIMANY